MDDLYFIRIKDGPVKIGRSSDVGNRLVALQCASPYDLELLGILDACGEHEADFHYFLRANRLRGEWFEWTGYVANAVNTALSGGDWKEMLSEPTSISDKEDWRIGSPLYV